MMLKNVYFIVVGQKRGVPFLQKPNNNGYLKQAKQALRLIDTQSYVDAPWLKTCFVERCSCGCVSTRGQGENGHTRVSLKADRTDMEPHEVQELEPLGR